MAKSHISDAEAGQLTMFFVPEYVPMGDGSFKIIPGKPKAKLTIKEAAKVAGIPIGRIYELYHAELIDGERPSPRRILIYADSLDGHLKATRKRDHWTDEKKKRFRRKN